MSLRYHRTKLRKASIPASLRRHASAHVFYDESRSSYLGVGGSIATRTGRSDIWIEVAASSETSNVACRSLAFSMAARSS